MPQFVKDVEEIRQRAIQKIEDGAVTSTYGLDKDQVVSILNEALATEIVCVLRYQHHYFMATGVHGKAAADEFKEHADEEREHADRIAERIQQLGGKPDFNPRTLMERSVSHYIEGESLADMIREDLIAERMVIDVYREMIKFFGDGDSTTRILIEQIMQDEEEHASDLSDLLYVVNPETGETETQDPGTEIGKNDREARMDRSGGSEMQRNRRQEEPVAQQANRDERQRARQQANDDAEETLEALGNTATRQQDEGRSRPQVANATQTRGRQTANRKEQPKLEQREGGGRSDRGESRSTGQERPGTGRRDVQPAHSPGTTGRVMARRGRNDVELADDDIAIGGQTGTNRSPKVVQKNRKNRAA